MITVELDIYSGQENKRWNLTDGEAREFRAVLIEDLAVVRPLISISGDLGPTGFVIHLTGDHASVLEMIGVPSTFRIADLPVDPTFLDSQLGVSARGDIDRTSAERGPASARDGGTTSLLAACSLAYTSWNAANYATNNWSRPGRKGGNPLPQSNAYADRPSTTRFSNAMTSDGWKTACNGESLQVVGYVGKISYDDIYAPEWDYHFYRKNLKNEEFSRWCHKPGQGNARNTDYSGDVITNVAQADRSKYFPPTSGFPIGVTLNYNERMGTFHTPAGTRVLSVE